MCLSGLTQIIYGVVMTGTAILTAAALFTPSWSTVENTVNSGDIKSADLNGLMPWSCVDHSSGDTCTNWWANLATWLRVVVVCMCLALIIQIVAVLWNILTCLSCCCKKYIIHPLTILALLSTIFLLISVVVYAAEYSGAHQKINTSTQLGYSYWLSVAALILSAADVVFGTIAVFFGEHCC